MCYSFCKRAQTCEYNLFALKRLTNESRNICLRVLLIFIDYLRMNSENDGITYDGNNILYQYLLNGQTSYEPQKNQLLN